MAFARGRMNVFFVLDRSDSVPAEQQEAAKNYINATSKLKKNSDKVGVIVFGTDASIETTPNSAVDLQKIQAVVGTDRSDLAAAIRLGTAAFPENGQKRLVLLTDGNEKHRRRDGRGAGGGTPQGECGRCPIGGEPCLRRLSRTMQVPSKLKKGQAFEVKIFVQADRAGPATIRLYRKEVFLGEKKVDLSAGQKSLHLPANTARSGFLQL